MDLTLTVNDLANLIVCSESFKASLAEAVKGEIRGDIMPLLTDIEALKSALSAQGAAVDTEFNQVKTKFDALHAEIDALKGNVKDLTDKVTSLENIDLSAEINAVNDSLKKIDAISESDAPAPTPAPTPAA